MGQELETVEIKNPKVNANLDIVPVSNPVVILPQSLPDKIEIISSDWSGEEYAMNVYRLACTCPDFIKKRSNYSQQDPRRVCKHLRQKLIQQNVYQVQSDLCEAIINAGWVAEELHTYEINKKSKVAFMYGGSEWINIYIRNRKPSDSYGIYSGKYNDYGLSSSGDYWTYGRTPPGAIMIKALLSYNGIIPLTHPSKNSDPPQ